MLENNVVRKIFGLKQHSVNEQIRISDDKKRHEFGMLHSVLRRERRYRGGDISEISMTCMQFG